MISSYALHDSSPLRLTRHPRLLSDLVRCHPCALERWIAIGFCLFTLHHLVPAQVPATDEPELVRNTQTIRPLLHNAVLGIAQDHRGYIWIIGWTSLHRYDGFRFQCFSASPGDSLLQRWMYRGMVGGRHGILCIYGSGDEIVLYDVDSNSAHLYQLAPRQDQEIPSVHASFAIEDSHGRFLIATREGRIYRVNPRTREVEILNGGPISPQSTPAMPLTALAEDSNADIWAGGTRGVICVTRGARETGGGCPLRATDCILAPESVAVMLPGRDGKIWVGTLDGKIGIFDPGPRSFIFHWRVTRHGQPAPVRSLAEDRSGNLWIGTPEGLDRWRVGNETSQNHLFNPAQPPGSGTPIPALFVDQSGLLWICASWKGLFTYAPWRHKFRSSTPSGGDLFGLSGPFVTSTVLDRRGTLWVGTMGTYLNYLPHGSRTFRKLRDVAGDERSLGSKFIVTICERRNGDLWVGTIRGVSRLKAHSNAIERMRHSPGDAGSLGADTVNAVFEDRDGTVWVGHLRGVDRYEDRSGKFSPIIRWSTESVVPVGTAGYFFRDSRGNLWIATSGRGLLRLGRTAGDSVWYRHQPGRAGSLPSNYIDCLREDDSGRLWVGSHAGLSRFDHSSGLFTLYTILPHPIDLPRSYRSMRDPSPDPGVVAIVPDRRGNLWLSTHAGLVRFTIATGVGRRYGEADGIVVKEGMRHAMVMTPDGWIYCGGVGGLNWFHPDSLPENTTPPPIAVADFRISGRDTAPSPVDLEGVLLDHTQNTFWVKFVALDYTSPLHNQFMYKLEGADQNWVHGGTDPSVTYARVPPGSYILRVRASNSDGIWNTTGLSLPILIEPPYWQTWWFRALAAVLFTALLYALHRFRLSKKLQLERMRVDIARDLHDEIGTSLSSIALSTELVQRKLPPGGAESNSLSDVVRAARTMADRTRDIVWVLAPEHESLSDLVLRMRSEASRLLPTAEITFATNHNDAGKQLDMELRRHLLLIFKEILHNIARHSCATHVEIRIDQHDDILRLSIDDNGVGFSPSNATTGFGLQSLRERAKKIGAALEIRSKPGEGTSVSVEIPCNG